MFAISFDMNVSDLKIYYGKQDKFFIDLFCWKLFSYKKIYYLCRNFNNK